MMAAASAEAAPLHACLDAILGRPAWQRSERDTEALVLDLISASSRVAAALAAVTEGAVAQGFCTGSVAAWLRELAPHPLASRESAAAARRAGAARAMPLLAGLHAGGAVSTDYLDAALRGCEGLAAEVVALMDDALAQAAPTLPASLVGRLIRLARPHAEGADGDDDASPEPSTASFSRYGIEDRYALTADLDALSGSLGAALFARLSRPTGPDDTRTAAQRRGSALTQIFRLAAMTLARGEGGAAPPHGVDAHVVVIAHADTVTGEPGAPHAVTGDGSLVDRGTLLGLCCDSSITTTIVSACPGGGGASVGSGAGGGVGAWVSGGVGGGDDAGDGARTRADELARLRRALAGIAPVPVGDRAEVLYVGRAARMATRAQWLAIVLRDRTCRSPGCDRDPYWCQAHHLREWDADGGGTDLDNLVLLCWEHHTRLHQRREHLVGNGDGTYRVVSATAWRQLEAAA